MDINLVQETTITFIKQHLTLSFYCFFILINFLYYCHLSKKEAKRLNRKISEIEEQAGLAPPKTKTGELRPIIEKFTHLCEQSHGEVNVEAFIESQFQSHNRDTLTIRGGSGNLIMLGLLGTFFGLFWAIKGIDQDALRGMTDFLDSQGRTQLMAVITGPIGGMQLAFVTSIFGVCLSLSLNWLDKRRKGLWEEFSWKFENYLTNHVMQKALPKTWEETGKTVAKSIEKFLKTFNQQVQKQFQKNMKEVSDRLIETATKVETASNNLEGLTSTFQSSAENFKDSSDSFRKTTEELPQQILDMKNNLEQFQQSLTTRNHEFSETVQSQQETFKTYQEDMQSSAESVLKGLGDNYETFRLQLMAGVNTLTTEIREGLKSQREVVKESLGNLEQSVSSATITVESLMQGLTDRSRSTEEVIEEISNAQTSLGNLLSQTLDIPTSISQMVEKHEESLRGFSSLLEETRTWMDNQKENRGADMAALKEFIEHYQNESQNYLDQQLRPCLDQVKNSVLEAKGALSELTRGQTYFSSNAIKISNATDDYTRLIQGMNKLFTHAQSQLSQTLDKIEAYRATADRNSIALNTTIANKLLSNQTTRNTSDDFPQMGAQP